MVFALRGWTLFLVARNRILVYWVVGYRFQMKRFLKDVSSGNIMTLLPENSARLDGPEQDREEIRLFLKRSDLYQMIEKYPDLIKIKKIQYF